MRKLLLLLACMVSFLVHAETGSAPAETVVTELFSFLVSEKFESRLGTQQTLMDKWLTPDLLTYSNVIECDAARAWKEENRPLSYVDAEMFFDRWDTPTQCKISGLKANDGKYVADIECRWGKGQDHSEGETIQLFVYLFFERGWWKVANIKHGRQEEAGNTKTDLITRMRNARRQSSHPEYCEKIFGVQITNEMKPKLSMVLNREFL